MSGNICRLFLAIFLICTLLLACSPQDNVPPEKSRELLKSEQDEFTKLLSEVREDIRVAHLLALDLGHYSWADFSDIAYFENPIERTGKRVLLSTILPSEEAALPLIQSCELCLNIASQLASYNPYEQAMSQIPKNEQMSLDQWHLQSKKLYENLEKSKSLCIGLHKNSSKLFELVLETLKASHKEAIQDKYVNIFITRTGQYSELISDLAKRLDEAEVRAETLVTWGFAGLGQGKKY